LLLHALPLSSLSARPSCPTRRSSDLLCLHWWGADDCHYERKNYGRCHEENALPSFRFIGATPQRRSIRYSRSRVCHSGNRWKIFCFKKVTTSTCHAR